MVALTAAAIPGIGIWANSPYISRVYEYRPAPGQFVNTMPEYEPGDDAAAMAAKAGEQLVGAATPGLITLGAYGGYVVFGFDHPVVNLHGRYDFQVYGNAMPSSSTSAEPGVVSVSVDVNGNGLPDDPWYELAGSDYALSTTHHKASVVYTRPAPGHVAVPDPSNKSVIDSEYIAWSLTEVPGEAPTEGWLHKVSFHTQSYWPEWLGETLEFSGTHLADNGVDLKGDGKQWATKPLHWGYADNLPNAAYKGFSIDWAVDEDGRKVELERIDFVKVHTGVLQNLGWLGEESTEIAGAEDLHPDAVYSPSWPADPIDPAAEYGMPDILPDTGVGVLSVPAASEPRRIYDLRGVLLLENPDMQQLRELPSGIYIDAAPSGTRKIRL